MFEIATVNFVEQIHRAFSSNTAPECLISQSYVEQSDRDDAEAFRGIEWKDVSISHWNRYSHAYFSFSPEAFRYYLPSIILNSHIHKVFYSFAPADFLISTLDTSGVVEYWDQFILKRFIGLHSDQYTIIRTWIKDCPEGDEFEQSRLERAYSTVLLFEKQT